MESFNLVGKETAKSLMKAFAGESQARNRYVFYASVARKEGFIHIADVFQETADNEEAHAKRFWNLMHTGGLNQEAIAIEADFPVAQGSTYDNLISASQGEHEEGFELYPQFADIAEKEGLYAVAAIFKAIASIEKFHEDRFLSLAETVKQGQVFQKPQETKWICTVCGYIHEGTSAPEVCPACGHPQSYYRTKN